MPKQQLKTERIEELRAPESYLEGLYGLISRLTKDSVMEPGFVSELTAKEGTPIDYDNISSLVGGRIREGLVEPLKNAGEAIHKGMTGQQISIKDLLAITEVNMDLVAGRGFTAALSKKGLNPNLISSFPAYHGGPSSFKKFKDKAIGSGEGFQYFGRGHYVTQSKGIGKDYSKLGDRNEKTLYKNKEIEYPMTGLKYKGKTANYTHSPDNPEDWVMGYLDEEISEGDSHEKIEEVFSSLKNMIKEDAKVLKETGESDFAFEDYTSPKEFDNFAEWMLSYMDSVDPKDLTKSEKDIFGQNLWHLADELRKGTTPETARASVLEKMKGTGEASLEDLNKIQNLELKDIVIKRGERNLYKVTAHKGKDPSEYDYMDWYKPVDDPNIIKKLKKAGLYEELDSYLKFYQPHRTIQSLHGKALYEMIGKLKTKGDKLDPVKEQAAATEALKKAGISGIQYDAGTLSGGAKPGTKNFVVFDPKDISIKEHYKNEKLQGIKTWHGSKYDVEGGFSDEAFLQGAGEMSHGAGHYVSNKKEVGQLYARDTEFGKSTYYKGKPIGGTEAEVWAKTKMAGELREEGYDSGVEYALQEYVVDDLNEKLYNLKNADKPNVEEIKITKDRIKAMESLDPEGFSESDSKNLYEATLHKGSDPSKFNYLNWDKTLAKQRPKVQEKLKPVIAKVKEFYGEDYDFDDLSGEEFYDLMLDLSTKNPKIQKKYPNMEELDYDEDLDFIKDLQKEASKTLKEAGFSGIKYQDEYTTIGASNFVVFDPKDITIEDVYKGGNLQP